MSKAKKNTKAANIKAKAAKVKSAVERFMLKSRPLFTKADFFTVKDINKYNRPHMFADLLLNTPGGSYSHKYHMAYFGVGSYGLMHEKDLLEKRFRLVTANVDGYIRPVLVENPDGNLKFVYRERTWICPICKKKRIRRSLTMRFAANSDEAEIMSKLLWNKKYPSSPKFELRIVRNSRFMLAFEAAEIVRV
jgi:hypothetical protein